MLDLFEDALRLLFCAYTQPDLGTPSAEFSRSPPRSRDSSPASVRARDSLPSKQFQAISHLNLMDLDGFKACVGDLQFTSQVRAPAPLRPAYFCQRFSVSRLQHGMSAKLMIATFVSCCVPMHDPASECVTCPSRWCAVKACQVADTTTCSPQLGKLTFHQFVLALFSIASMTSPKVRIPGVTVASVWPARAQPVIMRVKERRCRALVTLAASMTVKYYSAVTVAEIWP